MGNIPNYTVFRQVFFWLNRNYKCMFADPYAKKLFTGNTILLFLEAMMNMRHSTEAIATNLASKKWLQREVNLTSIDASTLNRKLSKIDLFDLQEIYGFLIQRLATLYAPKSGLDHLGKLRIIDSTELRMPKVYGEWAYLSDKQYAVKMHTSLLVAGPNDVYADRIVLSTADIDDKNPEVVEALTADATEILVMDRGFIRYGQFATWTKAGVRFVARLRADSRCRILHKRPIEAGSNLLLDADVEMVDPVSNEAFHVRLVEYKAMDTRKKKEIRIRVITTCRDLTAKQISDIYRYRWKIELYFKWLKQHVNLKKFYSYKQQAVWNQIYLSLIAHALCELIRQTEQPQVSCWRLLQHINAYAAEPMEAMWEALTRSPTRTSRGRRKKGRRGRPRKHPKKLKHAGIIIK